MTSPTYPSTFGTRALRAVALAAWALLATVAAAPLGAAVPNGAMATATTLPAPAAGPLIAGSQAPTSAPSALAPWDDAFAAFAAADRAAPPPAGGVLFVGSSSIRLWHGLETAFDVHNVVLKRGFGGSQLADCVKHLGRLVVQYRPALVLVYAGDNDLAAGGTPDDVLRRFAAFVEGVHRELPATRIDYISIKPSPLRAELMPAVRATNALIRDYVAGDARLAYVDVFTPMLRPDGRPRADLFVADGLHLNADGYALWKSIIDPYVQQAAR
jgi:lysophospholipase L1-like esterase